MRDSRRVGSAFNGKNSHRNFAQPRLVLRSVTRRDRVTVPNPDGRRHPKASLAREIRADGLLLEALAALDSGTEVDLPDDVGL